MIRGLMSDREWACLEAFAISRGAGSGRRPRNHRLVMDGIFWIARTGVAWRDLPEYFGKWSSVYRQFRRWTLSGLWELPRARRPQAFIILRTRSLPARMPRAASSRHILGLSIGVQTGPPIGVQKGPPLAEGRGSIERCFIRAACGVGRA